MIPEASDATGGEHDTPFRAGARGKVESRVERSKRRRTLLVALGAAIVAAVLVTAWLRIAPTRELAGIPSSGGGTSAPPGGGTGPVGGAGTQTVLVNGTSIDLAPRWFMATLVGADTQTEIYGQFSSSGPVECLVMDTAAFQAISTVNSSEGALPANLSIGALTYNWSSGSVNGAYVDTFLDGGTYELVFLNPDPNFTRMVHITADFVTQPDDVN
jgi:hypothetical protein